MESTGKQKCSGCGAEPFEPCKPDCVATKPPPEPDDEPSPAERAMAEVFGPAKRPRRQRPKSKNHRWAEAVAACRQAVEKLEQAVERAKDEIANAGTDVEAAFEALKEVQAEYVEWHENFPENMQSSPTYEKLETIAGIDLEVSLPEVEIDMDELTTALDEADAADLPLGFGRD